MNRQVILPGSKKSKAFEQTTSDYMIKKWYQITLFVLKTSTMSS
jgi:hypothetical protein